MHIAYIFIPVDQAGSLLQFYMENLSWLAVISLVSGDNSIERARPLLI